MFTSPSKDCLPRDALVVSLVYYYNNHFILPDLFAKDLTSTHDIQYVRRCGMKVNLFRLVLDHDILNHFG